LRELNQDAAELGAALAVIGNGSPEQAADFQADFLEGVHLLTDPSLTGYKAMELKRSLFSNLQPRTYLRAFSVWRKGLAAKGRQGDSLQQGGAFVITPRHEVVFCYFSKTPEDHADPEEILESLSALENRDWGWQG